MAREANFVADWKETRVGGLALITLVNTRAGGFRVAKIRWTPEPQALARGLALVVSTSLGA
jgi:hypothetical protein